MPVSRVRVLAITSEIAREWGRLAAAVRNRVGLLRARATDLGIAATANSHAVPLLTHNSGDFQIIRDLTDARPLPTGQESKPESPSEPPSDVA